MHVTENKPYRILLLALGWVSLILGIIGAFLPILPTTPFLILASWCFVRSSKRMHDWLYRQKYIGKVLMDWEKNGSISPRAKITAVLLLIISAYFISIRTIALALKVALLCILAGSSIFIVTRPNK